MKKTAHEVLLEGLIKNELSNIPLSFWGYFFPCYVATGKFIHEIRPDILGEIKAGFTTEPYFEGDNAEWLVNKLGNETAFIDIVEELMMNIINRTPPAQKERILERGFYQIEELPEIDVTAIRGLVSIIIHRIDSDFPNSPQTK